MDTSGTNPYHSPSLSSHSPNVPEEQATEPDSSILHHTAASVVGEASRELQRQFQHTSTALDAAYDHIRQVRRRLLELTESLPAPPSTLRSAEPEIGHAAGMRSPPPEYLRSPVDAGSLDTWSPMSRNQTLPSVRSSFNTSPSEHRPGPVGVQQQPTTLNVLWNQRLVLPTRPVNRASQADDGSTLLGRRVAARLGVAPTPGNAGSATSQSIQDIYEGTRDSIVTVTRVYGGEVERDLSGNIGRRRNSTMGPLRPALTRPSASARRFSQDPLQLSPHSPSEVTPWRSSPPSSSFTTSPLDLGLGNTPSLAQQGTGSSERPSLLSNFSAQNFPAPSTPNMPSRPLNFDEPLSYVSPDTIDPSTESRYHPTPDAAFSGHRSYVVQRNYDRSGEEVVHNITVDWDDGDPLSWLMPSSNVPHRQRHHLTRSHPNLDIPRLPDSLTSSSSPPPLPEETTPSTNNDPTPRRRGWARLDLDGNEIPSEEEEEYERLRAGDRIRATRRAQILASIAQSMGVSVPSTPPRQELTIYHNTKPPVVLRHDPSLSYPADFVNPLPMPLSEMVDTKKTVKRKSTLLPRHSVMAGR